MKVFLIFLFVLYLPVLHSSGRGVIGPGPEPAQINKALYVPTLKAVPPPSFSEVASYIDRTGKGEYSTEIVTKDGLSIEVQHAGLDTGRMSKAELNNLRLYLPETQASNIESSGARLVLCPPGHPAWITLVVASPGIVYLTIVVHNRGEEFIIPYAKHIRFGANLFWIPAVDVRTAEISSIRWDTGSSYAFDYAGGCFWVN